MNDDMEILCKPYSIEEARQALRDNLGKSLPDILRIVMVACKGGHNPAIVKARLDDAYEERLIEIATKIARDGQPL